MKYINIFLLLFLTISLYAIDINEFTNYCEKGNLKKIKENISQIDINSLNYEGTTPLIRAINSNNEEIVNYLIENGADINLKDKNQSSPIIEASKSLNYNIIKTLIDKGANINDKDIFDKTPLIIVTKLSSDLSYYNFQFDKNYQEEKIRKKEKENLENKLNIIKLLLNSKADFNLKTKKQINPIIQTILDYNIITFDLFVQNGLDINTYINDTTLLNFILLEKNILFFNYLVGKNVDLNFKDQSGDSPIYSAIIGGNLELVKFLIEHGVDINCNINNNNDTPLSEAVKFNKEDIVDYLIKNGADINSKDNNYFSPIHDSILNPKILKMLIDSKCNINAKNNMLNTPLHLATSYNKTDSIKLLVDAKAYLCENIDNKTPLDYANKNNIELLEKCNDETFNNPIIMDIKENKIENIQNNIVNYINFKDDENNNILYYCIKFDKEELLKYFIEKNNNIDFFDNKNIANITPLLYATMLNKPNMIKILNNANVNISNLNGITPIINAIKYENIDIIKYLIDKGADLSHKDINNYSIYDYAYKSGNLDIINLIIKDYNESIFSLFETTHQENIENILLAFINNNGNLKYLNNNKQNILHIALLNNMPLNIIKLLANDTNINQKDINGETPIMYAIRNENIEIIKYLYDLGSKFSNIGKYNVLHIALNYYNDEVYKFLLDKEKNINKISPSGTPLNIALEKENYNAIKLLLEAGADVNISTHRNPLTLALLTKDQKIVDLILNYNPKYYKTTDVDEMPLILAAKDFNLETIKKLVEIGYDINCKNAQGFTPLHIAIFNKTKDKLDILDFLLSKGANINAKSTLGLTPIHNSACINDIETTKFLNDKGASIKITTNYSQNALDICKDRGYKEILDLYNEKPKELKENEKYDTCDYKIRLYGIDPKIHRMVTYLKYLIDIYLVNGIVTYEYSSEDYLNIYVKSPYVIGEIRSVFFKMETEELKLENLKNENSEFDIVCKLVFK